MSEPGVKTATTDRAEVVRDFASSALFDRTFQDGMNLVEDTAAYLDGAGRQESRLLSRTAALAYASESMRLTTQLMQVASWLLVQRAVREGDMSAAEACEERYRIGPQVEHEPETPYVVGESGEAPAAGSESLPQGLMRLVERTKRLHERVSHLDQRMYRDPVVVEPSHPVLSQFDRVRAALEEDGGF